MHTLYKEIRNEIEEQGFTFIEVAKRIGVSKQTVSKFISKGEIGFRCLVRLSYLLFPDNQQEVMANWCLRVNTTESIKQSFEYAAITRNINLLANLITKYKEEKGPLVEYVSVYSIIFNYMTDKISGFDIIENLKKIGQIKDEALKILAKILKCYNYYFQRKFHLMLETAKEAESELTELGKRELFFKECFLHRIAEALYPSYLHLNNLPLARHYSFIIINADICPKTVSDASYIVGMSYLVEDERKCVEYLQKSYDIAKTIQDPSIEKEARLNLDFVKLYLGIELDADSDIELINFQNDKDSEINLNSLKEVMYLKGEDDLVVLFEVLSSKSVTRMHECLLKFFQESNYYFASLMARELQKSGDDSLWAENAVHFTIKIEESVCFEKDFIGSFNRYSNLNKRSCA